MPVARNTVVLGVFAASMLVAGCGDFDDPAVAQGVTRNDLVAELATQLAGSASLTYVATYQLAGGDTGTIAQAPRRGQAAYRYPGGAVLLSTAATTRCVRTACTTTAPQAAASVPPATVPPAILFTDAQRAGLVAPASVLSLLKAAALSADLSVEQHDTTIAGRHATCVDLGDVDQAETGAFSTCITNEGVLGSFAGTLDGTVVDVALTDYTDRATADAFGPPPKTTMTDRR